MQPLHLPVQSGSLNTASLNMQKRRLYTFAQRERLTSSQAKKTSEATTDLPKEQFRPVRHWMKQTKRSVASSTIAATFDSYASKFDDCGKKGAFTARHILWRPITNTPIASTRENSGQLHLRWLPYPHACNAAKPIALSVHRSFKWARIISTAVSMVCTPLASISCTLGPHLPDAQKLLNIWACRISSLWEALRAALPLASLGADNVSRVFMLHFNATLL